MMAWLVNVTTTILLLGGLLGRNLGCGKSASDDNRSTGIEQTADFVMAAGGTTGGATSANAEVASIRMRDFELHDWLAFGSGCRSRPSMPGDVRIDIAEVPDVPGHYRVRFSLPDYGIRPWDPWFQIHPAFARECRIRLAIQPLSGKKLANMTSEPVFRVEKPAGPRARLRARQVVWNTPLRQFEQWYDGEEVVTDREKAVEWQPGEQDARSVFEGLQCEQSRMVGVDLSTAVVREDLRPAEVTLALDGLSLEIGLEFSDCSPTKQSDEAKEQHVMAERDFQEEREGK